MAADAVRTYYSTSFTVSPWIWVALLLAIGVGLWLAFRRRR